MKKQAAGSEKAFFSKSGTSCNIQAKGGKAPLLGGVRLPVQASLGWSPRPFTRRTISACGKVPLPGAPANAPPEGVRRLVRQAVIGLQDHLRSAQ